MGRCPSSGVTCLVSEYPIKRYLMKKLTAFAALLLVVLLSSFTPDDWVKVDNKPGRFSIMFPRNPEATEQELETEIGMLKMHIFMYEVGKFKDENAVYGLIYSDYPDTLVNSDFKDEYIDEFFENAIKGMLESVKGKVVSASKSSYMGKYPGKTVKISFMDGEGIMNLQVFLVKNRAYILQVGCEARADNNASATRFFKSFTITEPPKK